MHACACGLSPGGWRLKIAGLVDKLEAAGVESTVVRRGNRAHQHSETTEAEQEAVYACTHFVEYHPNPE